MNEEITIIADSCGGTYTRFIASVNGCIEPVKYNWSGEGDGFSTIVDCTSPNPTFIVDQNCNENKRTDTWTSAGSNVVIKIVQEGICKLCKCGQYEYRLSESGIIINVDTCGGVYYASPICQRKCVNPPSEVWYQFEPFSVKWEGSNENISIGDKNSLTQTFVVNDKFSKSATYTATVYFTNKDSIVYTVKLESSEGTCCECLDIDASDIIFLDNGGSVERYVSYNCNGNLSINGQSSWVSASILGDKIIFTAKERVEGVTDEDVTFEIGTSDCSKTITVKRKNKGDGEYEDCKCPEFPSYVELKPGGTITFPYSNICEPLTAKLEGDGITINGTGKTSGNLIITAKNTFSETAVIVIDPSGDCETKINVVASDNKKGCGCDDLIFTNGTWDKIEIAPTGETKSISYLGCDDVEVYADEDGVKFLEYNVNKSNGTINITSDRNCEEKRNGKIVVKIGEDECKEIAVSQDHNDCERKCECGYFNLDVAELSWSCGGGTEKKVNFSADTECIKFDSISAKTNGDFTVGEVSKNSENGAYTIGDVIVKPNNPSEISTGALTFTYYSGKELCTQKIDLSVLPSEDCLCSCSSFSSFIIDDEDSSSERLIWTNEEAENKTPKYIQYTKGDCISVEIESTQEQEPTCPNYVITYDGDNDCNGGTVTFTVEELPNARTVQIGSTGNFEITDDGNGLITIIPKTSDSVSDELVITTKNEEDECDKYIYYLEIIKAGCPCYNIVLGDYNDGIPCSRGVYNIPLSVQKVSCGDGGNDDDEGCSEYEYKVDVEPDYDFAGLSKCLSYQNVRLVVSRRCKGDISYSQYHDWYCDWNVKTQNYVVSCNDITSKNPTFIISQNCTDQERRDEWEWEIFHTGSNALLSSGTITFQQNAGPCEYCPSDDCECNDILVEPYFGTLTWEYNDTEWKTITIKSNGCMTFDCSEGTDTDDGSKSIYLTYGEHFEIDCTGADSAPVVIRVRPTGINEDDNERNDTLYIMPKAGEEWCTGAGYEGDFTLIQKNKVEQTCPNYVIEHNGDGACSGGTVTFTVKVTENNN